MPGRSAVLAVHGVSNRDPDAFRATVARLAEGLGRPSAEVVPVFWGDLAPDAGDALRSLPRPDDGNPLPGLRAGPPPPADPAAARALADRTIGALAAATGRPVPRPTEDAVRLGIADAADRGAALGIHADLAEALAEVAAAAEPAGTPDVASRGVADTVRNAITKVIQAVDREAGALLGGVLQDLVRGAEAGLAGTIATTFGDVLAYSRETERARRIRGRLDAAYAQAAAGADRVHVVAHSLGSLVATEWLLGGDAEPGGDGAGTDPDRRQVASFVTFGAQVALFSELHGLVGAAGKAWRGEPLPVRVGSWVNVWHQLDPLAFVFGRVLAVAGQPPVPVTDFRLDLAGIPTSGDDLGFHSSYWRDERFLTWLREQLP